MTHFLNTIFLRPRVARWQCGTLNGGRTRHQAPAYSAAIVNRFNILAIASFITDPNGTARQQSHLNGNRDMPSWSASQSWPETDPCFNDCGPSDEAVHDGVRCRGAGCYRPGGCYDAWGGCGHPPGAHQRDGGDAEARRWLPGHQPLLLRFPRGSLRPGAGGASPLEGSLILVASIIWGSCAERESLWLTLPVVNQLVDWLSFVFAAGCWLVAV